MRIVFVCAGSENIGVEYLSSALKREGHQVGLKFEPALFKGTYFLENRFLDRIFDCSNKIIEDIINNPPDLLGFSIFTVNFQWALSISKMIKERINIPIIFGGVHVTSVPEKVISYPQVDYICIGEAEKTLPEFVNELEKGNTNPEVRNIFSKKTCIPDKKNINPYNVNLDELLFPDKKLFYAQVPSIAKEYSIIAGRGCAFDCPYCSHSMYKRKYSNEISYMRIRSVDNIIKELKEQAYSATTIAFEESNFVVKMDWLTEFSEKYKSLIDKPFCINLRPDAINEERIKLLKEAGCRLIYMGIQTANDRIRKEILHINTDNKDMLRAAEIIRNHNIKYSIDHIFGLPGATIEDDEESILLYSKMKPSKLSAFSLACFPNTEMVEYLRDNGYIDDDFIEKIENGEANAAPDSKSSFFEINKYHLKLQNLMYLVPILPDLLIQKFIKKKIYRFFPKSIFLLNIWMLITAVKIRDWKTWNYIRYVLSEIIILLKKR